MAYLYNENDLTLHFSLMKIMSFSIVKIPSHKNKYFGEILLAENSEEIDRSLMLLYQRLWMWTHTHLSMGVKWNHLRTHWKVFQRVLSSTYVHIVLHYVTNTLCRWRQAYTLYIASLYTLHKGTIAQIPFTCNHLRVHTFKISIPKTLPNEHVVASTT